MTCLPTYPYCHLYYKPLNHVNGRLPFNFSDTMEVKSDVCHAIIRIGRNRLSWNYQWSMDWFLTTFWILHMHLSLTLPHLQRAGVFLGLLPTFTYNIWTLYILNVIQFSWLTCVTCYSFVKFLTPEFGLQGYWDPYPIDMEFRPPCMVLSTIGISKPGQLKGQSTKECSTHLHQLHVCLPSSRNKTRLLYRMSLDFAPVLQHIPFIHYLWKHFAEKVTSLTSDNLMKLWSIS